MKRFRFRLETVLQLRLRKEEELKSALGRKQQEIHFIEQSIGELGETLRTLQSDQKSRRAAEVDVVSLRHSVAYRHKLKLDMLAKGAEMEKCRAEALKIRSRLNQAIKDRRIVELLKEKRLVEWKKANAAQEQKFIDDLTQQRYTHQRKAP